MRAAGRAWADGILTRLAGDAARSDRAPWSGSRPISVRRSPRRCRRRRSIDDGVRDAVILEVSEEALHGFQYPDRLIEPALGGPDTAERAFVNFRFRLLRLATARTAPRSSASSRTIRRPRASSASRSLRRSRSRGDCPVVGGGGYTGFEHNLYRIEIADTNGAGALQVVAVERRPRRARPLRRHRRRRRRVYHRRRPRRDRELGPHRVLSRGAAVRRARRRLERRLRRDGDAQHRPRPGARRAGGVRHAALDHRLGVLPPVERHRRDRGVHQRRDSGRTARRHPPRLRRAGGRQLTGPATTGPSRCAPARSPTRRC